VIFIITDSFNWAKFDMRTSFKSNIISGSNKISPKKKIKKDLGMACHTPPLKNT